MRRFVGFALVVAMMAPALAVCAGAAMSGKPGPMASHDCCPKDDETAAVQSPAVPAVNMACCRMSDEAAARSAVPAPLVSIQPAPVSVAVASWLAVVPEPVTMHTVSHPLDSSHVPRHLLLSVLIV